MSDPVTLLIDADIIAYSSLSANYLEIEWEPDCWTYDVDMASAKGAMIDQVKGLKETAEADDVILCLTGPDNFRKDLLPSYKGHRRQKPPGYRAFQAWIQEEFRSYLRPRIEGDDVIGILATHPSIVPGPKVIWSGDKDLKQIPGLHLQDGKIVEVSEDEGIAMHVTQTLTGDASDNYKGCPGVGPKGAQKLLEANAGKPWSTVWAEAAKLFEKAGLTDDEFLVQARVARILTHELYNFETKEPILWTPPTS